MIAALGAGLVLALTGCSSMMETGPSDEVEKDVILSDAEGMEVALNGIYATMYTRLNFVTANAHHCFGNLAVTLAAELMGEDMVHTAQGAGWFWKDYTYDMRSRYSSKIWRSYFTWAYFYELIDNANYLLSAWESATGDLARRQDIAAQAYAVRAYCYFMLIQSFQQTYVGHQDAPGVPVYTEPTTSASVGKGRGTVEDVYVRICRDIDEALALFETSGLPQEHISHLDKYATQLLRARVALVMNDWKTAAEAAVAAMSKPGRSLISLAGATVVKGTFDNATRNWTTGTTPFNSVSTSSVLWGAEVITEQSTVYASFFSHMDACTNIYYAAESPKCISNWLYAQIPETDVRKGWWNGNIGVPTSDWKYGANINYNQFKFQWKNQKNYAGDYIFMRMEEACLIAAEAYCRLGDELEAKHWLSELESRRNPAYASRLVHLTGSEQTFASVGTVETLLDEILLQRRIELWGEAGRIYDILRLRKGWTRNWTVNGEPSNHTNLLSKYPEYLGFPADFRECIMMIPQAEIDNNPSIGPEDQNPYVE